MYSGNGCCALCRHTRELQDSHFVPKALYRLARAADSNNAHPVMLSASGRRQTSRQAMRSLLCEECEKRFDRNGEDWMMKHCYRGRGVFRLRQRLEQFAPIYTDSDEAMVYSASEAGVDIGRLVYFCTSVIWRASVCDWPLFGRTYSALSLGKEYERQIRKYLLNEQAFPQNAVLMVTVSQLKRPPVVFTFPVSARVLGGHSHVFHIPGITFLLLIGKGVDEESLGCCVLRSPFHPVFVCKDGDIRLQEGILKALGKTTPRWGEYPLL